MQFTQTDLCTSQMHGTSCCICIRCVDLMLTSVLNPACVLSQVNTVASIVRANALRSSDSKSVDVNFGSKATEQFQQTVGASA